MKLFCFALALALAVLLPLGHSTAKNADRFLPYEEIDRWEDSATNFKQGEEPIPGKPNQYLSRQIGTPGVWDWGHHPDSEQQMLDGGEPFYVAPAINDQDSITYLYSPDAPLYKVIDDRDVVAIFIAVQKAVIHKEMNGAINYTSTLYTRFEDYMLIPASKAGYSVTSEPVLQNLLEDFGVLASMGVVYLVEEQHEDGIYYRYIFERDSLSYHLMTNMVGDEYAKWVSAELTQQNAQTSDRTDTI